jgi:outer membrane lipoprotein-sorting protein
MATGIAVARRPLAALAAALLAVAALLPHAQAQTRDVGPVLAALEARAAEVVDLSFVLDGQLIDEGGQVFRVEVEVLAIPGIPAAGLYIIQPDAIADNQVVIDGDVVRSYTFLTNQVTLYHVGDPDAFGGLIEAGPDGGLPISLDLAAVFADWDARVVGEEMTARGPALVLRFDNRDPDATMQYVLATVLEGSWDPWRLAFYRAGDALFADLHFRDLEINTGLTRADVTYLPEDAEVLDRRR